MNPQQARARVAETFPQPFNRTKLLEFTRNLLNKFDETKAAQWNSTYAKDAFNQRDAGADVSAWGREILMYALYGLTPEEIQIVESASVKTPARQGVAQK